MEESTREPQPLNPYARLFFWLWGTAGLVLGVLQTDAPTYRQQLDAWPRQQIESLRSEIGWLHLSGPPAEQKHLSNRR